MGDGQPVAVVRCTRGVEIRAFRVEGCLRVEGRVEGSIGSIFPMLDL